MNNPVLIGNATLHLGDCIEVMQTMPENSLDSIICDPPYLISFMSRAFDSQHKSLPGANEGQKMQEWHRRWVTEAYRILKPGGHLAAFGGDRTHHRLMSAMEDVGFELRFGLYWCYGSGFPKSMDASKALDQHFGMKDKREVVGLSNRHGGGINNNYMGMTKETSNAITKPYHPLAKQWSGYGTATKPAVEICCVGRKSMIGTLAENLLAWGTGAMNLDACRVEIDDNLNGGAYCNGTKDLSNASSYATGINIGEFKQPIGRFPPHLLHDGSEVVKQCFPESGNGSGNKSIVKRARNKGWANSSPGDGVEAIDNYGDSGSASRFFPSLPYDEEDCATLFYCAKASRTDRNEGCELIDKREVREGLKRSTPRSFEIFEAKGAIGAPRQNNHVSVKPTNLMRWICRLLTPKGGTLLDPFMGSGSTLKAAVLENFTCIGIEMDADYFAIAEARVSHVSPDAVMVKATNPIKPTTKAVPVQAGLFEDAA